ncbi:YaiI/YqxD family protein [Mariniblastus fucicola]|uniref:UPF0178 protein MFFC18_15810 n=1 Tax=Mariniblastus fucicola TaxID=980251 RepID=A0A5B9P9U5_9BACT|nr:YaiI/YqxD family protein [Mariniblastus fucicola]QEG21722.1 hypothetical protein MFFC18_15810 [Mariniblastus fucicola]
MADHFGATIWIDADACPGDIKEVIYRASKRLKIKVVLVANQSIWTPESNLITSITVRDGADIADNTIVEKMSPEDIVVTGDIPLAARVVEKGGIAIGTRGELFDEGSIQSRLATRNLMEQFRAAGMETKGPKPMSQKDVQAFANQLDRLLTTLEQAKSDE